MGCELSHNYNAFLSHFCSDLSNGILLHIVIYTLCFSCRKLYGYIHTVLFM